MLFRTEITANSLVIVFAIIKVNICPIFVKMFVFQFNIVELGQKWLIFRVV